MLLKDLKCEFCKKSIDDVDYLGSETTGYIHLKCLASQVKHALRYAGKKKKETESDE